MNNTIHAPKITSYSKNWLIIGISFVSMMIGLVVFAKRGSLGHDTFGPATMNFVVTVLAFVAALLVTRRKLWDWSVTLLIVIVIVAVVGMISSLLHRDDYAGGTCATEWSSGHLHAGYPYSWLDGHICIPPSNSLSKYARQHPEESSWYPDFQALLVDLLFWLDLGILLSSGLGLTAEFRKQGKQATLKENAA